MPILATDHLPINRGGTPGDGSTGTYYVGTVQEVLNLIDVISSDAGNLISPGGDGGAFMNKSTIEAAVDAPTLAYDASSKVLTFTDHNGSPTNIDLSALSTDIYVDGATINGAGQLILTDNNGGTADIIVDMSAYLNSVTDDQAAGTLTLESDGGSTVIQKTSWMSAPAAP